MAILNCWRLVMVIERRDGRRRIERGQWTSYERARQELEERGTAGARLEERTPPTPAAPATPRTRRREQLELLAVPPPPEFRALARALEQPATQAPPQAHQHAFDPPGVCQCGVLSEGLRATLQRRRARPASPRQPRAKRPRRKQVSRFSLLEVD